jgi:hypothetical protein
MNSGALTRRDFLRAAGIAAIAATAGESLFARDSSGSTSKVILIRDRSAVTGGGKPDAEVVCRMLDEAMVRLFGVKTPGEAWAKIAGPADVVGIKTNVWKYLRTPVAMENRMKEGLLGAGVREEDISVDDRGVLANPVFQRATVLINARPMRAHNWSGVGGCLKNYIMFSPSPPDYHPDSCIDLGSLWNLPAVKGKTRLNVLLMLTPQFHCMGPHHFDPEYTWPYGGLLVGTDPVALDAVGLKIIEAKRRLHFGEDSPMRPPVTHIVAAEKRHRVGIADPDRIEVIRMGWKEEILI